MVAMNVTVILLLRNLIFIIRTSKFFTTSDNKKKILGMANYHVVKISLDVDHHTIIFSHDYN